MNVNQAIDALIGVALTVFPAGSQKSPDRERNSKNLKSAIEGLLQAREIPLGIKMGDQIGTQKGCKVYVYFFLPISYPELL
jgi:hypothetical protein